MTPEGAAPLNLREYETAAARLLPAAAWGYFAGGAEDERTLAENLAAFRRRAIRYRVLVDVTHRDLAARVLRLDLPHPIVVAPTALHKLGHPEGEAATARGAASAGALYTVSSAASVSLEDVVAAAPGAPRWFQLYCSADRARNERLIARAATAGYKAVVVTADVPFLGRRERDLRSGFALPEGVRMENLVPPDTELVNASWADPVENASLTWDDIGWLRAASSLPLLLKGVVRADDAARAADLGVAGIWVSNHGGRQLDGAIASLDALPEIACAVGDRCAIVFDGGVRRGVDALMALALGAHLVALGRPIPWGLAVGGADGVRAVLEMLRDELSLAMALAGCRTLADITPDLVVPISAG